MAMKKRPVIVLGGILIAVSATAAFVALPIHMLEASAVSDPRQEAPIVRLVTAVRVTGSERGFTGITGARVQSNLGFSQASDRDRRHEAARVTRGAKVL